MLILMDEFGRYKTNFAASSSFPVAVERCFTEIFQGYDINDAKSLLWESGKTSANNPVNLRDAVSLGNYTITQRHYDACLSEPIQVATKNASTVQDFIDHLTSAPDLPIKNVLYREISFLGFTTVQLITLPVPIFYMPMNIYPSLRSRNELLEGKYSITAENIGPIFTNFTRCHTFNDKLRHNINDVLVIAILAALNGSDYIQTAYNCYKDFCPRTETYDNLFTRLFVIKSFGCQPAELSELLTLANDLIKGEKVFSEEERTLASWVLSKSERYSQPSCENIQSLILLPEQEV